LASVLSKSLSKSTVDKIQEATGHYPTRLAALLPALHLVMDEVGYVTPEAAEQVATLLDIPPTRVMEAATFYTMFSVQPRGRHLVRICRNLACSVRGSDALIARAKQILGIELGQTTKDGRITLETDECLAACGTGPTLWAKSRIEKQGGPPETKEQIVESLTVTSLERFLAELK